jgi:hypothetical protein
MTKIPQTPLEHAQKIAQQALDGELHMFAACIELARLKPFLQNVPTEVSDVFRYIDSEIDDLPIGKEREHWNAAALAEKDKQIEEYLIRVRTDLEWAIRQIVAMK